MKKHKFTPFIFCIATLSIFTFVNLSAQDWTQISEDIFPAEQRIWSLKMVDDDVVWTCSSIGFSGNTQPTVYRSMDGGINWNRTTLSQENGSIAWDVAPIDSLHAFLSAGHIYKTDDGGHTWNEMSNYEDTPLYIHFFSPTEGWVAGSDANRDLRFGLTSDGGESWIYAGGTDWEMAEGTSLPEKIGLERPELAYSMLNGSYDIKGDMIIMNMFGGTYWVSYDRGYNWERKYTPMVDLGISASTVAIKNDGTYMFTGDTDTLYNFVTPFSYYTEDGGNTWIVGEPSINTSSSQYIHDSDSIFIVCGQYGNVQGTQITYDFGLTWETIDNTRILAADFTESGKGIGVFGDASQFSDFTENGKVYEWNFDLPSSTEKIDNMPTILTMPNPFTHHLTIDTKNVFGTEEVLIELMGLNGQVFMTAPSKNQSKIELSTKNLPSGIYTLKITGKHKMIVKKVAKI